MKLLTALESDTLLNRRRKGIDEATLRGAKSIVQTVRCTPESAIEYARRFGDLDSSSSILLKPRDFRNALDTLPLRDKRTLQRIAERIRSFAEKQRTCLEPLQYDAAGCSMGHSIQPIESVGCYVPGGKYSLPSSLLMTAIPARTAGVERLWCASPRPNKYTLAAAAIAEIDGMIRIGGAQAIAILAYGGCGVPPANMIVGPGNRWVTAAKQSIAGEKCIDMLAGPSEILIIADSSAPPAFVAADLLAQAEHDEDALPIVIAFNNNWLESLEIELQRQLALLRTKKIARAALSNGGYLLVNSREEAFAVSNELAPEHLQLLVQDPSAWIPKLRNYGTLFIGIGAAEVLGDYGIGPNHVLPTGGTATAFAGLSVFSFLRLRTWIRGDSLAPLEGPLRDAAMFARWEGLEAHARAAEIRILDASLAPGQD